MTNHKANFNRISRYGKRVLAQGVEVSNNTRISGCNNNDLICGNSGSGKTGGYVIPNIQCIDGSLVVSDMMTFGERPGWWIRLRPTARCRTVAHSPLRRTPAS